MSDLDSAIALHEAGRPAEAAAKCLALLEAGSRDADTLNLLGVSLFATGNGDAAAGPLEEAVRIAPAHFAARSNLAVLRQQQGDWAAAETQFGMLAVLDPAFRLAQDRLGTLRQERGDLDGALRALTRAVRLDPVSGLAWFNLASVRMLAGLFDEAMAGFRHAIAEDPAGAPAHTQLGEMLLRLGRIGEASEIFRRALRLDPAAAGAGNGLARCGRYRAMTAAAGMPAGGVAIRGPFESATGYGHFCQRLIRTLRGRTSHAGQRVPLEVIGINGPEAWPGGALDRPVPARAVVNCLIPLAVEPVPGRATVTFSMFEATRIPPAWRRMSESSDLIVVPTESSRRAWAEQGFPEERLRVCPLGVDPVQPGAVPVLVAPGGRLVSSYRHRFLNVSDFNARKNIDGLLRVWLRATAPTDQAVLILKLGRSLGPAARARLGALVRGAEQAVGRRLAEAAPVVLVDRLLTDEEMTGLHRAATHYWSLSHGEGWDLPMARAGAMGLGLIAPAHSAYLDYLDEGSARLIPSSVGPARVPGESGFYPPFHGLDWWVPDEEAATAILTGIIRGGDRLPSARDRLLERFTWERSADRLLAILDEAGLR
ncbi:tetratricopeptide (TPR) repeat protein [Azospirillum agricola]|uniref:tetratricopeptide repeat protein n=1 Tax=Azospirillum agricola TaxID=1720247 RepID=UPI001AE5C161|nr:tetratricopeptide repeat protein [Azospirillum agricola]MBP2228900.1 tetratricopeptide (TPR) repeat protein [Azospirillum agricola]